MRLMNAMLCLATPVLMLGLTTCSDDAADTCVSLCEEQKDCPESEISDCDGYCKAATEYADTAGCGSQWEESLECMQDNVTCDDDNPAACSSQDSAFETCVTNYCASNQAYCATATADLLSYVDSD